MKIIPQHLTPAEIDQAIGIALSRTDFDFERNQFGEAIVYTLLKDGVKLGTYSTSSLSNHFIGGTYFADPKNQELLSVFRKWGEVIDLAVNHADQHKAFTAGYTTPKYGTIRPSKDPMPGTIQIEIPTNLQEFEEKFHPFVEAFEGKEGIEYFYSEWELPDKPAPDRLKGQGWNLLFSLKRFQRLHCVLIWINPGKYYSLVTIPPQYNSEGKPFVEAFKRFCRESWDSRPKERERKTAVADESSERKSTKIILDDILEVDEDSLFRIIREEVYRWYKDDKRVGNVINTIGGIFQIQVENRPIGVVELKAHNSMRGRVQISTWEQVSNGWFKSDPGDAALMYDLAKHIIRELRGSELKPKDGAKTAVVRQDLEVNKLDHTQQKSVNSLQPKLPGRLPDPENEKAYQKILQGESRDSVFIYWCGEKNIEGFSTSKDRKRAKDAFRKAMKRAEARQNRT